jgi:hypothetical protein
MGTRAEALADTFEKSIAELIAEVENCSDAQWEAVCGDEKWTVAATAHHVGAQWPLEREYLDAVVRGGPSPSYSWDDINKRNEDHAKQFSAVSKADVVSVLRDGAKPIASWLRGLSDEQLDNKMALPLANGAMVSTTNLIEGGVLIDHAVGHLKSIRAAG